MFIIFWGKKLIDILRALVNEIFLEMFYAKRKKQLIVLTIFSHENSVKTFLKWLTIP